MGSVDGINRVFAVSRPYSPGSTAVFLNGLLQERSLSDGWAEVDPESGVIEMKEAPRSIGQNPDVIQVFFIDRSPYMPETQLVRLRGSISEVKPLMAMASGVSSINGRLSAVGRVSSVLLERNRFRGSLATGDVLHARLRECVK